jgi:mono/diheme cytochrome c family protein
LNQQLNTKKSHLEKMKNAIFKLTDSDHWLNNVKSFLLFSGAILVCSMQKSHAQQVHWKAPEWTDTLKAPFFVTGTTIEKGKLLFDKICSVCHGFAGKGDGIAGINLNPRPQDVTSALVQDQTDGAIFWKITTGKPPMAAYKTVLTSEQRWQLVSYIRKLKR